MKSHFLLACVFCLLSSGSYAQFETSKPVVCDDAQQIIKSLTDNYLEKLVWLAVNPYDNTRFSLFVNEKTGSWTLIQMNTEIACILGVGEQSTMVSNDDDVI